ncbi:MAG: GGDEF domain-containing protein [Elusimicrobia bacterium]|nr:GGDEF domain-containing protein [Elusimicrobiota bacterium]MDE2313209.1 GGDEF domain-containing protein [Elusimicrobiota bacterium]
MNEAWLWAAAAFLPAAALWAGYPRRAWAAAAVAPLAAGAALWILVKSPAGAPAWVLAAWIAAAAAYSWFAISRARRGERERSARLEDIRAAGEKARLDLAQAKNRGMAAGKEQKQALALYGLIKGLTEALGWEDVRPRLESAVEEYLGISDFAFYLAEPSGTFRSLLVHGLSASPGSSWITLERYLQEHGLSPAQAHVIENPEKAAVVPISDGEILGSFYARCPAGLQPPELMGKALSFAQEIAFAFRRIRIFQEMESLSRIDGLTGVHRRGGFDERLKDELVRAQAFKTPVSLLLLDIDHFKELNDRYGHPFGDQVLKRLGELLNSSVYETDFVARYGGEEFAVILPRAQAQGAARKAEAIRKTVEQERFSLGFNQVHVSVSIGLAHFPADAATPEELISQADAALYRAKAGGRNRVESASSRGRS